jgi:hypothetical protein
LNSREALYRFARAGLTNGIGAPAADHFHSVVGSVVWALSIRRHTDRGVSEQACNPIRERCSAHATTGLTSMEAGEFTKRKETNNAMENQKHH